MKARIGRPPLDIDEDTVEKLASIHCTMQEIASVVGCSVDTLENRFSEIIKQGRDRGKASLRRMQYEAAKKGNATLLIWLGKQILGQKDKSPEEIEAIRNQPVIHLSPEDRSVLLKIARGAA
jgi:hypothetical protein